METAIKKESYDDREINVMRLKNKIYKYKYFFIIVGLLFTAIFIPVLLDWFIFDNSIESNLDNSDWAGFLGSYIGGIATILAVVITIWFTTRENEKKQIKKEKEELERRKRSIKPYLETRCAYVKKGVEAGINDRIFIFDKDICLSVHSCMDEIDKIAMDNNTLPYMFNYKILNAGSGNAVNMLIQVNGFAERLVILKDETVNIYFRMNKNDVRIQIELKYSDNESLGLYEQKDEICLQGGNRGFAFSKGKIMEYNS